MQETEQYPFVSFIILVYNHERFVKAALDGAGCQEYPKMEIIISDDCSKDNSSSIIEEWIAAYKGPHRVVYNHNDQNLGLIRNLNKTIGLAQGEYFVMAGGDDIAMPQRVLLSVDAIKNLAVDSVSFNYECINSQGHPLGTFGYEDFKGSEIFKVTQFIKGDRPKPTGPSRIISRRLIYYFGLLGDDCQTEDTTLTFRSMLLGGVGFDSTVCVRYRRHENNISNDNNLLTRIDPRKICAQYRRDLEFAYKEGIVSKTDYRALRKYFVEYTKEQLLLRRKYAATNKIEKVFWIMVYLLNPKGLFSRRKVMFMREHSVRFDMILSHLFNN